MCPQNTQKKPLLKAVKWLVALVACGFIVRQLVEVPQKDWWSAFLVRASDHSVWPLLPAAILLMPVNWGIEAFKWQRMMRRLETVSFPSSCRAVLAGVTVSLFTPYRTGEFAGRVWVLSPGHRVPGALLTVAQSFSQLIVTLLAGTLAVFAYQPFSAELFPLYALLALSVLIALVAFFRISLIAGWMSRIRSLSRWHDALQLCSGYSFRELAFILTLSSVRYAVFVFQYYLLVLFFGVDVGFSDAVLRIAVTYLASALVPSFALVEPLMRGSMAVTLFGEITLQTQEVLFATSLLWLINVLLPAFAGCFTVQYEKSAETP
ncbi:MAG: hypothetical protein RL213_2148 [Bacteroidota bacterium]|jgi:hypothetical protein